MAETADNGTAMSSPLKDALTEFINCNTSAIEQAMDSGNHDLVKDDPAIPDLVNYLSSPSPHSGSKEVEPMSTNEKIEAPSPNFSSVDLQLTQQAHFSPCQLQASPLASQFTNSGMGPAKSEESYNSDRQPNQDPPFSQQDLHKKHCLNHSDSYDQSKSLYPDPSLHNSNSACGFQDVQLANPSTFDSSTDIEPSEVKSTMNTTGSKSQYCQDGQTLHYQVPFDSNKHYHHNQQTQLLGTENCVDQLQNQVEIGSNGVQSSSVLASSFISSVRPNVSYICGQDGLGFGLMDVNQASLNNLDTAINQLRAPEKMHVDETEVIFQPETISSSIGPFQASSMEHATGSSDVHMQSQSSQNFHKHSSLETVQASAVTDSSMTNVSASLPTNEFSTSGAASTNIVESLANFDISRDPYQSTDVPCPFNSQNYQQSSADLDFQEQPRHCQSNDSVSHPAIYLPQQLEDVGSVEPSFSSTAQHICSSSHQSSYQGSQYHSCPGPCHRSPSNISDGFHDSLVNADTPSSSEFIQKQHLHHNNNNNVDSTKYQHLSTPSFQTAQVDPNHCQPSHVLDLKNYTTDAPSPQHSDQHSAGFQNNGGPTLCNSILFPPSVPGAGNQHQHKDYINSSVNPPSTQASNPLPFIDYSSREDPLLSANICTSISQSAVSQTDYEMSASTGLGHSLTNLSEPSSDVTIRDFLSGGDLRTSSHAGFTDDQDAFCQLDLEAVVKSLSVETNTPTVPQSQPIITTVSYQPGYSEYEYCNKTSSSASFPVTSHRAEETSTHFSFNEHCQTDRGLGSCNPTLSSGICNQNTRNQFHHASFGLLPTSEVTNNSYHQPMQVQDSETPVPPYSYHNSNLNEGVIQNTETAMDVSSNLGEKGGGISCSISYEEIHMSIVKAGNVLSKEVDTQIVAAPREALNGSDAQTTNKDSLGGGSVIYSASSTGSSHSETSEIEGTVAYNVVTQVSNMTATSTTTNIPSSFNSDVAVCSGRASGSDPSPSDPNIFLGILNLQLSSEPSSQLLRQEQLCQQTPVTIPNFLDNPTSLMSHVRISNTDNLLLTTNKTQGQSHTSFAATAVSPSNSETLAVGSCLNQPQVAGKLNPVLNHLMSQASSLPASHQILDSIMASSQISNSSFFGQLVPGGVDQTSGTGSSLPSNQTSGLNLTGTSIGSSAGTFLQLVPQQADKTSSLSSTSDGTIKLGTHHPPGVQKSGTNITMSCLTPVGGTPSQGVSGSSIKQPHIIVSLEDLQKLQAQQNFSQPSPSVPQQQPYTTVASSPQTLVLQKHASHSLKQSQPRLLIRGATLPSQPRLAHPHQQLQQTREKLQLLMHQTHPPEHIPPGILSQRHLEPILSTSQENRQKISNPFQFASINHLDQQPQQKLHLSKHSVDQPHPRGQLQLKQTQFPQTVNLFLQQVPKAGEQKLAPLQLVGHQQLLLQQGQQQSQTDQKPFAHTEPQLHLSQKSFNIIQKTQNVIHLAEMQQELLLLRKQQEKGQEFEENLLQQFHIQHQNHVQPLDSQEKADRPCSDSIKKDYKHLHSLLTGGEAAGSSCAHLATTQTKAFPSVLNLTTNLQGQPSLPLINGVTAGSTTGMASAQTFSSVAQSSSAPFSFVSLSNSSSLQLTNSSSTQSSSPLTTLTFVRTLTAPTMSKTFDIKDSKIETSVSSSRQNTLHMPWSVKSENGVLDKHELNVLGDHSSGLQACVSTLASTERKRSHTPLSIDLNSPVNSGSEPSSPLSSPVACEDGNTQLTLIERSADLKIKSDSMHSVDDADGDEEEENANFDINAFHKRPSAEEFRSTREKSESVPMKIAKPSINTEARSGTTSLTLPDPTFDFGNAVTSASNFSFAFGSKEENSSDVFTFGLNGATTITTDTLPHKDGSKHYRVSSAKPVVKAAGMRSAVPTQPVRPTSRKQKEHSLKSYYPSKLEDMELKILKQPEPQHRARYQTEGSRGAIKDVSQQGFPVIKLFGYNKPAKLQVFIGDECGRVKPHGFYQACRVFGKNSTVCQEQEVEDTTVIEIDMLPENDMTVKLDCVGILKLRNADVERRIGPKRAREKKKTNTRARLVGRCLVEKSDSSQHILQVVSHPIVCTQPVGQPEISRMSLSESSLRGGESLFIIGKNFKNKGTSVLFQKLDSNDEDVVWQVEAEIEQEFFQPTHLICKIPAYKDEVVDKPQSAQIVVSCAGKRSDPHSFIYKPVYQATSSMKQDTPMDTDSSLSMRPMSFVSSEAVHLNRMVQLSNAHSVPTTTIRFQLPQSTISVAQTADVMLPSTTASSHQLTKPVKLLDLTSDQTLTTTSSAIVVSASSSGSTLGTPTSSQTLPSFLLEEKADGLVPETSCISSVKSSLPYSISGDAQVSCIGKIYTVHSNSNTSIISPMSYSISDNHRQPSLTSSSSKVVQHDRLLSVSKSSSLPSTPFFVVVDPAALKSQFKSCFSISWRHKVKFDEDIDDKLEEITDVPG